MAARGGKDDGDVREQQVIPHANDDDLAGGLGRGGMEESDGSEYDNDDVKVRPGRKRQSDGIGSSMTPQTTAMRELAENLCSAGIPYASKLSEDDTEGRNMHSSTRFVEDIVTSLTRAEGNVLTQTL